MRPTAMTTINAQNAHYRALALDPGTSLGRLMGLGPGLPEPKDGGGEEAESEGEEAEEEAEEGETEGEAEEGEAEGETEAEAEAEAEAEKAKPKETKAKPKVDKKATDRAVKRAVAKAIRDDRAKREAELKKEAERANMDETQRLKAERDEAVAKAEALAESEKTQATQLRLANALAGSPHRLVSKDDLGHVGHLVSRAMNADDLDESDALAKVAEDSPHLFAKPKVVEEVKAKKAKKATTTAGGSGNGKVKAETSVEKVDANKLSNEDFQRELNKAIAAG